MERAPVRFCRVLYAPVSASCAFRLRLTTACPLAAQAHELQNEAAEEVERLTGEVEAARANAAAAAAAARAAAEKAAADAKEDAAAWAMARAANAIATAEQGADEVEAGGLQAPARAASPVSSAYFQNVVAQSYGVGFLRRHAVCEPSCSRSAAN